MLFSKSGGYVYTNHIVVGEIVSVLNLEAKTITYLAERFKRLDLNRDGFIDYDEFCAAFRRDPIKHKKQMKPLFDIFNNDNNNKSYDKIGFDEFLVGVSVCFMDNMIDDAIKIMFKGCLNYNTFTIKKENFLSVYNRNVDLKKFVNIDQGYNEWVYKMKNLLMLYLNLIDN